VPIPRDVRGVCACSFHNLKVHGFSIRSWIQETLQLAREEFVLEANATVSLRVDMAAVDPLNTAGEVELTMRSWGLLVEVTGALVVTVVQTPFQPKAKSRASRRGLIQVFVKTPRGKSVSISLRPTSYISDIADFMHAREGIPRDHQRFICGGTQLELDRTLADYNITEYSSIHMTCRLTGGKPVIYLQSSQNLTATVLLALSRDWSFSAIYPLSTVSRNDGQDQISWTVDVKNNGSLLHDVRTATDVSYLYWEA